MQMTDKKNGRDFTLADIIDDLNNPGDVNPGFEPCKVLTWSRSDLKMGIHLQYKGVTMGSLYMADISTRYNPVSIHPGMQDIGGGTSIPLAKAMALMEFAAMRVILKGLC